MDINFFLSKYFKNKEKYFLLSFIFVMVKNFVLTFRKILAVIYVKYYMLSLK